MKITVHAEDLGFGGRVGVKTESDKNKKAELKELLLNARNIMN